MKGAEGLGDYVQIRDLSLHEGQEVSLRGWLYAKRGSGKVRFLVVRDGTGYLQCVASAKEVSESVFEDCSTIGQESSLEVSGSIRSESRAPGGFEMGVKSIKVLHPAQEYPITPKDHGPEFLLDYRHLWLRSSRPHALLRIRNEVCQGSRDFFYSRDFVLIDSPMFTPAACEGTSTLFETDYFGEKAYLTQSGQLYLEPACMAFGKVYCFGPTFRAEKSKTRRHLTEFWMLEPEVAFAELTDILTLAEDLLAYLVERVLERNSEDLKVLERDTSLLEKVIKPFPQMTYDEAANILLEPAIQARAREQNAPPFERGNDFGGFDETVLTESLDRPVIITHYPTALKAFYMQPDAEDPSKALCVDVLAPEGYGEIIGGSQRIHDHDLLLSRIREHQLPEDAFRWYLEIRKYGTVPHSGFGMGIERVVSWLGGVRHLREAIPYPRMLNRLYP